MVDSCCHRKRLGVTYAIKNVEALLQDLFVHRDPKTPTAGLMEVALHLIKSQIVRPRRKRVQLNGELRAVNLFAIESGLTRVQARNGRHAKSLDLSLQNE